MNMVDLDSLTDILCEDPFAVTSNEMFMNWLDEQDKLELIKCRECGNYDTESGECDILCGLKFKPDDYCSYGRKDPERIDEGPGKWIPVKKGEQGYSAGDFRCNKCGKPNKCYTLTKYCPNCGQEMSRKPMEE